METNLKTFDTKVGKKHMEREENKKETTNNRFHICQAHKHMIKSYELYESGPRSCMSNERAPQDPCQKGPL